MLNSIAIYGCALSAFNITLLPAHTDGDVSHLKRMNEQYCKYGLRFPPNEYKLAIFEVGSSRGKQLFSIGFINPSEPRSPGKALVFLGLRPMSVEIDCASVRYISSPSALKDVQLYEPHLPLFESNSLLAVAIQCYERKLTDLAVTLYNMSLHKESCYRQDIFSYSKELSPKSALGLLAWTFWANELATTDAPAKQIEAKLKLILENEPSLQTIDRVSFLDQVRGEVAVRKDFGCVENAIEDFITKAARDTSHGKCLSSHPSFWPIIDSGLDAVQRLAEHLDDSRMTRIIKPAFNNAPTRFCLVKEVVSEMLPIIAVERFLADQSCSASCYVVDRATFLNWWTKASKTGERVYYREKLEVMMRRGTAGDTILLRIMSKRTPYDLKEVYHDCIGRPQEADTKLLAYAIAESTLSRTEKVEVFRKALESKSIGIRRIAQQELDRMAAAD